MKVPDRYVRHFLSNRDADDIGPFLEVLIPEGYFWIPFEQIERIEFRDRQGYQDTIWLPAYIQMKGGIEGEAICGFLRCIRELE